MVATAKKWPHRGLGRRAEMVLLQYPRVPNLLRPSEGERCLGDNGESLLVSVTMVAPGQFTALAEVETDDQNQTVRIPLSGIQDGSKPDISPH